MPAFPLKSKGAVPKTEILEQPHFNAPLSKPPDLAAAPVFPVNFRRVRMVLARRLASGPGFFRILSQD
jgi:hypothetical protein